MLRIKPSKHTFEFLKVKAKNVAKIFTLTFVKSHPHSYSLRHMGVVELWLYLVVKMIHCFLSPPESSVLSGGQCFPSYVIRDSSVYKYNRE